MAYITADQRRPLMHVLVRANKAVGFSPTAAIGEAIREIEGGDFPWWIHFKPSPSDVRLLRLRGVEVGQQGARHNGLV